MFMAYLIGSNVIFTIAETVSAIVFFESPGPSSRGDQTRSKSLPRPSIRDTPETFREPMTPFNPRPGVLPIGDQGFRLMM